MANLTKRKPTRPGEVLKFEYLKQYNLSIKDLAERLFMDEDYIRRVVQGESAIHIDVAVRLGKLFNTTPQFWMNLQISYNLYETLEDDKIKYDLNRIIPVEPLVA